MKFEKILALLLACVMTFALVACSSDDSSKISDDSSSQVVEGNADLWDNATYTEDVTIGEGDKTVTLTVTAGEKSIVVTIKTNAETLGEALRDTAFATGDESEYGLYVKTVNGITADYDIDMSYWGLLQNGEYTAFGVDGAELGENTAFEFRYEAPVA